MHSLKKHKYTICLTDGPLLITENAAAPEFSGSKHSRLSFWVWQRKLMFPTFLGSLLNWLLRARAYLQVARGIIKVIPSGERYHICKLLLCDLTWFHTLSPHNSEPSANGMAEMSNLVRVVSLDENLGNATAVTSIIIIIFKINCQSPEALQVPRE